MQPEHQYARVPQEMTKMDQWVCWENRDGRKIPINAKTGQPAKSNDPDTWADFETACKAVRSLRVTGIGFMFSVDDDLTGIDLDECIDDQGKIAEWALVILSRFDTYAEISPSGRGFKLWCRGTVDKGRKHIIEERDGEKSSGIEVYDRGRYFTVTGQRWEGLQNSTIGEAQEQLNRLLTKYWPEPQRLERPASELPHSGSVNSSSVSIQERAARYLAKVSPAVSGQNGHSATLLAAEHLVRGFCLSDDDAYPPLSDWSQSCEPPWSESELRHKLDEARTKGTAVAWGAHLQAQPSLGAVADWPALAALPDQLGRVEPFDIELLPRPFRSWIDDIAERLQCPPDFPAVAAMVSVAGIVGRKIGICPQEKTDWLVVPNLWGAVIGRPGIMKTPALQEPLNILKRMEIDAKNQHDQEMQDYAGAQTIARATRKVKEAELKAVIKNEGDADEIVGELMQLDKSLPVRRRYMVNDGTVEKLGEILCENSNGVTVFRDEMTGLLKGLDKQGQEGARAFYLEFWNGNGRYTFDLIGRGTIDIPAAILSLIGGIQPGPLSDYLRKAASGGAGDDGLLQRFQLAVWPDCPRHWKNVDRFPNTAARQLANETCDRLDSLRVCEIGAEFDPFGSIPYLRFDPAAQECFNAWRAELEPRLRSGNEHPSMESHLAKYRSLVPTLALLIHLCDNPRGGAIPIESIERAVLWARYLETHARRIYSSIAHRSTGAAHTLAAKIEEGSLADGFTARDVYRPQWSGLTERDTAQLAVDVLQDHGWLRSEKVGTGGAPSTLYRINPQVLRKCVG